MSLLSRRVRRHPAAVAPGIVAAAASLLCAATGCSATGLLIDSGEPDAGLAAMDVATPDAASVVDATPDEAVNAVDAPDEASVDAGPGLNILFIGNSYTAVNDLPDMLASLATSSQVPPAIHVSAIVVGGADLGNHWVGPTARPTIAKGGWTHVVLQDQSVDPVVNLAYFLEYAALFAGAAHMVDAMPTFYETWARADGDPVYMESWSGGSPGAMQDKLLAAYRQAATDDHGLLAPAGEAWRAVRALGTIQLFQMDGSHPTVAGTYLTACVFYVKLTSHAVPANAAVPAGVDQASAALLRDAGFTAAMAF